MSTTSLESLLEDESDGLSSSRQSNTRLGLLVVFEGIDKTGKSSHLTELHKRLQADGYESSLYSFPSDRNPIGKLLRQFVSAEVRLDAPITIEQRLMHQLFAAERLYTSQFIEQDLEQGKIVLLDRYYYSSYAYNYDPDWDNIEDFYSCDRNLPCPDLLFLFTEHPPSSPRPLLENDMYKFYQPQARQRYLNLLDPKQLPDLLQMMLPSHIYHVQYRSPFEEENNTFYTTIEDEYILLNCKD